MTQPSISDDLTVERAKLLASPLLFTKVFYELRTGREFEISEPVGRESHHLTIFKLLKRVFNLEILHAGINIAPGSGKSEMVIHFIAWAMAHYPDSNFLYISYSSELAAKHTYTIRQIIDMPLYKALFGVSIRSDSSAKDNFTTEQGGSIMAFGSSGSITGQNAGLPNLDRFSGAIVMDDMHKPGEVHSDSMRNSVIENYNRTVKPRARGINVPYIFIGQCLHEADLSAFLKQKKDGNPWDFTVLKSMDEAGNVLYPKVHTKEFLVREREYNPYVYAAQYQQDPMPEGGGLFRPDWFPLLDEEPQILSTFITADSAETSKTYNDATVFSFWGIYKIKQQYVQTDEYGLLWLDCLETWVEPKDLYNTFLNFYASCMRHSVKPKLVCIEKKSTGATLHSILSDMQGLQIIDLPRLSSKTDRFLEAQPYIAQKRVALLRYAKHTHQCIEHMKKITPKGTQQRDDIADTCADAVKIALIDKTLLTGFSEKHHEENQLVQIIAQRHQQMLEERRRNLCRTQP